MGYGLFRTIMSEKNRSTRQQKEIYQRCLHSPGPDMFICDEGHILKVSYELTSQLNYIDKSSRTIHHYYGSKQDRTVVKRIS